MSGFVGLFQRDGRPADPAQLAALAGILRLRGPDGTATWQEGGAGLGYARFATHLARDSQPQPLALGGRWHLVGHIRLDAREDLVAALEAAGVSVAAGTQDAALVLLAHREWREACVERLRGEFAFAIWDAHERRLFGARDPFGTRPFFYAVFADLLLFGNTLACLRAHPRVGAELNELALADFLACGQQLDADTTFFRDVRRLPGGHRLTATADDIRVERYWTLPQDPYLDYRQPEQYVEHFVEVLSRAVADRAGSGCLGISLSGGLDSGAIAAVAAGKLGRAGPLPEVRAYCSGWNRAFDDPEPGVAAISGAALGIPLDLHEVADCVPLRGDDDAGPPEPQDDFFETAYAGAAGRIAADARILLDGQGGDEVFRGELLLDEAARAPWGRLARDALATWRHVHRPPLGLRAQLERLRGAASHDVELPAYLAPEWRGSLQLEQRYRDAGLRPRLPRATPRAEARSRLLGKLWRPYLESCDAGFSGVALTSSWPYLDHRVVRFALALPPFPWCVNKHLTRRALAPVLPAAIVERPKSPLAGDPLASFLSRTRSWDAAPAWVEPWLGERIDPAVWRDRWRGERASPSGRWSMWEVARPVVLARWLRQVFAAQRSQPSAGPPELSRVQARGVRIEPQAHPLDG